MQSKILEEMWEDSEIIRMVKMSNYIYFLLKTDCYHSFYKLHIRFNINKLKTGWR